MHCWMNQGTTMCYKNTEKDIECCNRYEFEAIELKYNLICGLDEKKIKELLKKNEVRVGSIGAIQLPVLQEEDARQKGEKKLRDICRYADVLDSKYIIVIPPRGIIDTEWFRIAEDAINILEKYSDIAKEYNVKLALEIMGFRDSYIRTIKDALFIVHMVQKQNVGLVYDFYHALGMEDLGQAISEVKPDIISIVHINDGKTCIEGDYIDENRLWPFDGDIDIDKQIGMLQKIGYKGPFSMEVYQRQAWLFNIEECYRIAQRKMRKVRSIYQRKNLCEKKMYYDSGLE